MENSPEIRAFSFDLCETNFFSFIQKSDRVDEEVKNNVEKEKKKEEIKS